jgi:hypothetical protein
LHAGGDLEAPVKSVPIQRAERRQTYLASMRVAGEDEISAAFDGGKRELRLMNQDERTLICVTAGKCRPNIVTHGPA